MSHIDRFKYFNEISDNSFKPILDSLQDQMRHNPSIDGDSNALRLITQVLQQVNNPVLVVNYLNHMLDQLKDSVPKVDDYKNWIAKKETETSTSIEGK